MALNFQLSRRLLLRHVATRYPSVAPVLLDHGLSCFHPITTQRDKRSGGGRLPYPTRELLNGSPVTFSARRNPRASVISRGFATSATAVTMTQLAAAAPITLSFTPGHAALGGLILGIATVAKLLLTGRVLGISGAVKGIVNGDLSAWRFAFLAGMLVAAFPIAFAMPGAFDIFPETFTLGRAAMSGLLVGLGAALGNGCTSGHGICGMARLSVRSLAYTGVFMAAGMLSATLTGAAAALGVAPEAVSYVPLTSVELQQGLMVAATAGLVFILIGLVSSRSTPAQKQTLELVSEAGVGATFAAGLGLCGMTHPAKVVAFLSPFYPAWDLSLPFVMGSAVLVSFIGYQSVMGKLWPTPPPCAKPQLCTTYSLPSPAAKVDGKLLLGGVLFGLGWGASGMCPGPALISLAHYSPQLGAYLAALVVGMWLEPRLSKLVSAGALST